MFYGMPTPQSTAINPPALARQWFPCGEVFCEMALKKGKFKGKHLTIRRYLPSEREAKAVFKVHLKALESVEGFGYAARTAKGWDKDMFEIEKNHLSGNNDFLVAMVNSEIVGCVCLFERKDREPSTAEFTRLRVDPDYFGCGIATEMYHVMEKVAKSHGFTTAYADTSRLQEASIRMHLKEGWKLVRMCDTDWSRKASTVIVCFEKRL
jgi:GNAT superfamily N-acetyltransferase